MNIRPLSEQLKFLIVKTQHLSMSEWEVSPKRLYPSDSTSEEIVLGLVPLHYLVFVSEVERV